MTFMCVLLIAKLLSIAELNLNFGHQTEHQTELFGLSSIVFDQP